jgi:signal transduction histidine kinase
MSMNASSSPSSASGVGTVTRPQSQEVVDGFAAGAEDAAWRTWEGILPTRRPPIVIAVVVFATTVVLSSIDPIAFAIDGTYAWPEALSFQASVILLYLFCAAQSASLLLTTRWPTAAVVATIAVYVLALFVIRAPTWVAPMQLAIIAALFLLGTRRSTAYTLVALLLVVAAQFGAVIVWTTAQGLTIGVLVGFLFGQSLTFAAGTSAATVLGLWWGGQARRLAQVRAHAETERRAQAERVERARELERARIAQELHDVAAQHIAGLVSLADAALSISGQHPQDALSLLGEVRTEGRFAAASLYTALSELRATGEARAATTPDARNIDDLVQFWRRRDMRVRVRITGDVDLLPAVISATAYRIVQEALTNTAKHAPGADVEAELTLVDDRLTAQVINGPSPRGIAEFRPSGLSWGLSGLRERVTLLGGTLEAGPTEQGGWRVWASIPTTETARATEGQDGTP